MTSAYNEAMTEREQKAVSPRGAVNGHHRSVAGREPGDLADMEEGASPRIGLATGDPAGEEYQQVASCAAEIVVSSGESLHEDSGGDCDGGAPRTTDGRVEGDEEGDEEADEEDGSGKTEPGDSASASSETSDDASAADRPGDGGHLGNERQESSEGAATRASRKGQVKDQVKDNGNRSVTEARAQEGRARTARRENAGELVQDCQGDFGDFYDAVRTGNVGRVSALIASGRVQNPDEPDWNVSGDPPLLVAATNQCLPVLSTLLASGCDPAVRSPRGETALHRVIKNGGPSNVLNFVEDLLKHGCPPSVKEAGSGSTALHVLSRQLAHTPLKSLHLNFDTALKTLELLAKAGLVNIKDHQGRSPLHILASSVIFDNNEKARIESLIATLLDAGADAALKNDRGETPLHESLECGALNTAELLIPHTPTGVTSRYGETPLHIASRKNHVNMVTQLLAHGEDPGAQDAGGNTPLHLAAARGFHQTVSLLVTSPLAQLENVNIDGLTALQVATESRFINAVRILLKAGADPSQIMHYCATTLRQHPDISLLVNHELTRRRQLAA